MKKFLVLLIIAAGIFTGCGSNPGKDSIATASTATPAQSGTIGTQPSDEPTSTQIAENQPIASPETSPAATKNPVELNFEYSRKPAIADWKFLEGKLTSLSKAKKISYMEFRLADLSELDLSNESDKLKKIWFDTFTIWPEKLPEGFDPKTVMELGRNPGLGIRSLQEKGITGKGVNIAIIDQTLLIEHVEYRDQLRKYDEVGAPNANAEMHGPFVASISVGKTCGVAPEAGLYFTASKNYELGGSSFTMDYTHYAESINKILDTNKSLPENQKIRAISISAIWTPDHKGYKELAEAIDSAKKEGIFVISCNLFETYGFWYYGLDRDLSDNPEKPESFTLYDWDSWVGLASGIPGAVDYYESSLSKDFKGQMLLLPLNARTFAEPTGIDAYSFDSYCGWSSLEPYLAGLYAMACQVKPDVTPEEFWKAALKTGDSKEVTKGDKKYPAKMINPVKLIESLQQD